MRECFFKVELSLMIKTNPFIDPSSRWYYPLHWLVLIFLGLTIYAQTFGFNFVFDDLNFIFVIPTLEVLTTCTLF